MTAGDPLTVQEPIPAGNFLEIRPPIGAVWMIKNMYFGDAWEIYRVASDGGSIIISSGVDDGMLNGRTFIVRNEIFLSIKNASPRPSIFGFDGLVIQ